ncbi:MAG: hypothetical protein RLZZ628_246 [Bacteroidota bacterium]|jgi:hypothetical protein
MLRECKAVIERTQNHRFRCFFLPCGHFGSIVTVTDASGAVVSLSFFTPNGMRAIDISKVYFPQLSA